jgi:hypothetical protein
LALEVLGKQILFFIDSRDAYSVLPAFAGELSSQTAIVVELIEKEKKKKNLTPPLPCHIETHFFYA